MCIVGASMEPPSSSEFVLTNSNMQKGDSLNRVSNKVRDFEELIQTSVATEDSAIKSLHIATLSYKNIVMGVQEKWIGGYECPKFILSELEERQIAKPWENGL
ncbi:hypothetical protein KIW84_074189 [Lathyrus oleraceus]|uniref:Uncharacterized protein n=1 Tax=Pisum sativum TaxID=3888 RepID=A0A9D4VS15_PEA|nr:hypothetical protein KIW84_074189 [Pisum sativum]